jgi:hypothetical protein
MINDILEISEEYTQNDLEKIGFLLSEAWERSKCKTGNNLLMQKTMKIYKKK